MGEGMSENIALAGDERSITGQAVAAARLAVVDLVDVGELARRAPSEHDYPVVPGGQGHVLVQVEEGANSAHVRGRPLL